MKKYGAYWKNNKSRKKSRRIVKFIKTNRCKVNEKAINYY